MADDLTLRVGGAVEGAVKALDELKSALQGLKQEAKQVGDESSKGSKKGEDGFKGLASAAGQASAAIGAAALVVRGWVSEASEAEDAAVRLETALRNQGTATPQVIAQFDKLAAQFQRTTKFSDEMVASAMTMLVQIGNVLPKDMERALQATTDLAAGLRIDLDGAARLVSMALEGNTTRLKRMGINLDETRIKTEGASYVFGEIAAKMGGQASAQAATFSGQIARVGNIVSDVKEILGGFVGGALKPAIDAFIQLPEPVRTTATAIGLIGSAGAAAAGGVLSMKVILPLLGVQVPTAAGASTAAIHLLKVAFTTLWPVALAAAVVGAAAWIGQLERVKNAIATFMLDAFGGMTKAEAAAAVQATALAIAQREQAKATEDAGQQNQRTAKTTESYAKQLATAYAEVKKLTPAQIKEIEAAKELGVETDLLAKQFKISEKAIELAAEQTKKDTEAKDKAAKKAKELAEETKKLAEETFKLAQAEAAVGGAITTVSKILADDLAWRRERNAEGLRLMQEDRDKYLETEKEKLEAKDDAAKVYLAREKELYEKSLEQDKEYQRVLSDARNAEGEAQLERDRKRMEATGQVAWETYDRMKRDGTATAQEIDAEFQKAFENDYARRHAWVAGWMGTLDKLTNAFAQLAQVSGGTFAKVAREIGTFLASLKLAADGTKTLQLGITEMGKGKTIEGLTNIAAGAMSIAAAFMQATATGNTFSKTLKGIAMGAQTGAQIGGMFGPAGAAIGAGIGAAVGGVAGLLRGIFGDKEGKQVNRMRDQWVAATYGTQAQFRAIAKEAGVADALVNQLLSTKKVKEFQAAQAEVLEQIQGFNEEQQETLLTADVDAFTEKFPKLLKDMAAAGSLASESFRGVIRDVEAAGQFTDEINEYMLGETQRIVGGIGAFVKNATVSTTESAHAMTGALVASFAELTKRGMSAREAIEAMGPTIDALQENLRKAGLEGGTAWDTIHNMTVLARDEMAGPALTAIDGLNQALIGLHNTGMLDQQTFAGLTNQVTTTFNAMIAQGRDGDAALRMIQPTLQTIWQLQQDYGLSVDAGTQSLIDQGLTAGLVGNQHRDAQDRVATAMERVALLLEAFITSLGVDVPAAAQVAEDAVGDVVDTIEDIPTEVTVDVGFNVDDPPSFDFPDYSIDVDYNYPDGAPWELHHKGGVAGMGGLFRGLRRFHGGGEVPAMLERGEGILSRGLGMPALGSLMGMPAASALRMLNEGVPTPAAFASMVQAATPTAVPSGDIYLAVQVDPMSGASTTRRISYGEFKQIEQGLRDGLIRIPRSGIVGEL